MFHIFELSLINMVIVAITVLIHYEVLSKLTRYLPVVPVPQRFRIVVGVAGALVAHVVEVWIFAYCYYVLVGQFNVGEFVGNYNGTLLDCFYFSFSSYTTVGFGDIAPIGDIRYLAAIESLVGFVLITWTASFLYLEMADGWKD